MLTIVLVAAAALTQITRDEMNTKMQMKFLKNLSASKNQSNDGDGIDHRFNRNPIVRKAKMYYFLQKYTEPSLTGPIQDVTYTTICEGTADVNVEDFTSGDGVLSNQDDLVCNVNLKVTPSGEARPHEIKINRHMLLIPAEAAPFSKLFLASMRVRPVDEPWSYGRYAGVDVMTDAETKHLSSQLHVDSPTGGETVFARVAFEDLQK